MKSYSLAKHLLDSSDVFPGESVGVAETSKLARPLSYDTLKRALFGVGYGRVGVASAVNADTSETNWCVTCLDADQGKLLAESPSHFRQNLFGAVTAWAAKNQLTVTNLETTGSLRSRCTVTFKTAR